MKTSTLFVILFEILLVSEASAQTEPLNLNNDASAYCFNKVNLRNSKDLHADPENCHNFYHCFYVNETYAIGHRRSCPEGQYFAKSLLQCVPEALGNSCQADPCSLDRRLQCHAKTCSTFYVCSNLISHAMCCPKGTTFNQTTCSCDSDEAGQCQESCEQLAVPSTTTPKPSRIFSDQFRVCTDSFGNYLQEFEGRYDAFYIFHVEPNAEISSWEDLVPIKKTEQACSYGAFFNLEHCSCTDLAEAMPIVPPAPGTVLYLPLDDLDEIEDRSANRFSTFLFGSSATYDQSVAARGNGSVRFQGDDDRLEIPGLTSLALGQEASWCLFYRCDSESCNRTGGLLSNDDSSENGFSIKIISVAGGSIEASVRFFDGAVLTVSANGNQGSFAQVCVVYQSSKLALYVDKKLAASSEMEHLENRQVGLSHGPYVVGKDPVAGSFHGWIDEIFVRRKAMTEAEIAAHFEGSKSLEANGLSPYSDTALRRTEVVLDNQDPMDIDESLSRLRAKTEFIGLRIFRGTKAPPEFGFSVYLILDVSGTVAACGGSLINRQFVLTAAHCTAVLNAKSKVTAVIGYHDITKIDGTGVKIEVERYWNHVRYRSSCFHNQQCNAFDYSILKLKRAVNINNRNIRLINLPFNLGLCKDGGDVSDTVDSCTTATAVGWGLTEEGTPSNFLRQTSLNLVSRATCSKQYNRKILDAQVCAGWGLTDTCNGDSGGPLFCHTPGQAPYLIGLTSFGSANCNTEGMPGVYSRVCKEQTWMQQIVARNGGKL